VKRSVLLFAATIASAATANTSGEERWVAFSKTAYSITGDIALSPTQLKTARATFPLAVAADIRSFGADEGVVAARVLRVTRPSNPALLNGNRLCQGPVRWVAVWRTPDDPKMLVMAAFSGRTMPRSIKTPGLCGTYYYSRP
jgi:hypothetical protein